MHDPGMLNRQEYRDLQQQIMDTHRALSDLERKLRDSNSHNHSLESDVSKAVIILDMLHRTLEHEFREYR